MDIMQMITSVGFPITACLGVAWYTAKIISSFREEIREDKKLEREENAKEKEKLYEMVNQYADLYRQSREDNAKTTSVLSKVVDDILPMLQSMNKDVSDLKMVIEKSGDSDVKRTK